MFIGSSAGSYLPSLWGGSVMSFTGLFFSALGGGVGIWLGYKVARSN